MARITVDDCLVNVSNRFELVALASRRARQLADGAEPLVEEENDKPTVIALREIAAGLISNDVLDRQEAESEARELEQLHEETQVLDPIAEEIGQMLSQNNTLISDDDEDNELMGFQTGTPSSTSSSILDDDDEELLG